MPTPRRDFDDTRSSSRDPSSRERGLSRSSSYDEVSEIGRGGMGVVYRARDRESGDLVAIKVLEWQGDKRAAARFRREIEALSRIKHLNVVRLRGSGWQGHRPYLVMDWIEGQDLEGLLFDARKRNEPLEISRVVDTLTRVGEAVAAVHDQRLIHRDIKPANILIENFTRRPVLVDFGIVKRGAVMGLTMSREVLGTPNYMSPEQLDPQSDFGEVSTRSDVWGLGATLYKTLTGHGPFDAPTLPEIYSGILTKVPQAPSSLRPDIPAWLDQLCLRCLEKVPERRPSLADFLATLRSSGESSPSLTAPARKRRRNLRGLLISGAVLLAALGVLAALAMTRSQPVPWSRLEDLNRWSASSKEEQRLVAEGVAARLGPEYALIDLRLYKGEPALRIARFRHLKTGAVLHLIPGGDMTMGRSLSRADRDRLDEASKKLEKARAEKRKLKDYLADPQGWLVSEMNRITYETNLSGTRMAMGDRSVVVREMSFLTEDSEDEWREVRKNLDLPQSTSRSFIIDLIMRNKSILVGLRDEYLKRKLAYHRREVKRRPELWRQQIKDQDAVIAKLRWITTVPARSPAHRVRLKAPFLIGESELSWSAWQAIPGHRGRRPEDKAAYPVRDLSWDEAAAWLEAAGGGLRLPSETEWEYACRARSTARYYWGDEISGAHCRYEANSRGRPGLAEAKGKRTNAFGLVDMLGNVAEWCADDWLKDYTGKGVFGEPRRLSDGVFEENTSAGQVVRGGGYDSPKIMCRSRARWSMKRQVRSPSVGLRIARSFTIPSGQDG